jgi:eukaryotic-like serine/threonine-protein kinase
LALSTGDQLGPYEIVAPLARGGMGEVYRARDVRLGREVALKVLPEAAANDAENLARFEREARAVAALNHPNILSIHDTGEHRGIPYAVTELLEGETLSDRLRSGPLAPKRATEIAAQVADGLAAAHARGVVHRDIKPENVFLTNDGRAKILDFGIARIGPKPGDITARVAAVRGSSAQFVMGTAGYMSPEQVRGRPIDFRTDVFSLGACFYEMLTGRRAFDRPSVVETMASVLKDDPTKFPETEKIPDELRRFVFRCLEKDPADRYQTARDLMLDLRAYQAEQLREAAERVTFRTEPPWKHRKPRIALRAAGGVLLFVLGFWSGSCWQKSRPSLAGGTRASTPPASALSR